MKRLSLQRQPDQSGLVSIVVVSVITILLALITLGFSKLMDRELRQSLDRELSTQAYYAAESGLNDARTAVLGPDANLLNSPNRCVPVLPGPFVGNGTISGIYQSKAYGINNDQTVKVSCVLGDLNPKELVYDVNAGQSAVFKITPNNLNNLYFSWENKVYTPLGSMPLPLLSGNPCSGSPLKCALPEENAININATGVLRVTIYPIYNTGYGNDPDPQLAADSRTFFLYPNLGNGITPGSADFGDNGAFVPGNCNSNVFPALPYSNSIKRFCNAKITGLNPAALGYFVHVTAVYRDLSISIQGTDSASSSLQLPGAEALIDVTGEGNDVLRRVRAYVPFDSGFAYPDQSVSSMQTVCKRIRLPKTGPGANDFGPAVIDAGPVSDGSCDIFGS